MADIRKYHLSLRMNMNCLEIEQKWLQLPLDVRIVVTILNRPRNYP